MNRKDWVGNILVLIKVLSQHLSGGTEESHDSARPLFQAHIGTPLI